MLNWIIGLAVPIILVLVVRARTQKGGSSSKAYDPKTGLGRGAPGFQTNIKRIAVPPEIIARIRAGEEVSADEITAAQDKMRRDEEEKERLAILEAASGGGTSPKKKKKGTKK
ncbi:hypothetical protein CBS101457_003264 [Exobasidium rhododendri]|nr:hypothetical protein CBS101457_003264 [Exobasidium rhododendri]